MLRRLDSPGRAAPGPTRGTPDDRPAPSRRALLRGGAGLAAGAAATAALTGCGSTIAQGFTGGEPPADRLNFWNPFTGGDGERMVAMQELYEKAHPDSTLRATTFVWGNPYYTKLSLATIGKRPPHVAIAHLSKLPVLAQAGLLSELPADALAAQGMTPEKFDAKPWRKSHVDDRLYGVPIDTHPFALYFRTDIAEKAGLLEGGELADVDGPDKFADALRAAKEVTGVWGGSVASIKDTATQFRMFLSFYSQLGGRPLVADGGSSVRVDLDAAEEALAYIQRLGKEKLIPTGANGQAAITLLTNGEAGFLMDGVWQIVAVLDSGVKFDMRPLPRVFDDAPYACFADSHALVLPRPPKEDDARLELSLEFTASLLDSSKLWAEGGHIPAWLPTQRSAAYQELTPQSHYTAAAEGAVYDPVAWYGGAGSNLQNRVGDAVSAALAGRATPRAAANRVRSVLTKLADVESPI
ncbi:extracellular solute-binding protein [Streptomyces aculeolatus]|uniref:extracellular solute-binding protein n=1 Tax=Streptomyces aculeolatus TaxID=270689 RepID=UPI0021F1EE81|nr:extracellular solute-binding protein [Streptomyces aculeolatus]